MIQCHSRSYWHSVVAVQTREEKNNIPCSSKLHSLLSHWSLCWISQLLLYSLMMLMVPGDKKNARNITMEIVKENTVLLWWNSFLLFLNLHTNLYRSYLVYCTAAVLKEKAEVVLNMFCHLTLLYLTTQGLQPWTRNLEPLLIIAPSQNKVLEVTIKDYDKEHWHSLKYVWNIYFS